MISSSISFTDIRSIGEDKNDAFGTNDFIFDNMEY